MRAEPMLTALIYVKTNFATKRYTKNKAFLLIECLNSCSVTEVPGTKYSVKFPIKRPKIMLLRGRATPEASAAVNAADKTRWSLLVPVDKMRQ